MSTPRKQFFCNSPYSKPMQYPSQSEDYISLDMGGPKQKNPVLSSNEKTPGYYNPKYYQQNLRNSNSKANKRNLFNNNYDQQCRKSSFNQQRFGSRKSSEWSQHQNIRNSNEKTPQQHKNYHYDKKDTKSIASYIHPSMTEDPWFELTQRLQAIEKSQISLKEKSPSSDKSPNANSDEDQEADSATSD